MGRHPSAFFSGVNMIHVQLDQDNAEMLRRFMRENGYTSLREAVNDLLRDFCKPCVDCVFQPLRPGELSE